MNYKLIVERLEQTHVSLLSPIVDVNHSKLFFKRMSSLRALLPISANLSNEEDKEATTDDNTERWQEDLAEKRKTRESECIRCHRNAS